MDKEEVELKTFGIRLRENEGLWWNIWVCLRMERERGFMGKGVKEIVFTHLFHVGNA
jgi:hypothetical protein